MKMSDVWPSGFSGVDFSYGVYLSAETLGGEKFKATENEPLCGLIFSCEEPAKATMHAINNHDRLEQENAELREALRALVRVEHESGGSLGADGSFYYRVPEGVFRKAKELLNK